MGYDVSFFKAWSGLEKKTSQKQYAVKFLNDEYTVDIENKKILSSSCNIPAKQSIGILILHYLIRKLEGLPPANDEWVSFKHLVGGEGYYPTFKKRVIGTIVRKYKDKPEELYKLTERFKAKTAQLADISVVIDTFHDLPVLITFWRGDDEFGPEANLLFNKSLTEVFCTEDLTVLAEIVVHSI